VPFLQQAKKVGGWITLENSVKARSYHSDLQTMTTPLEIKGHIYHVCYLLEIFDSFVIIFPYIFIDASSVWRSWKGVASKIMGVIVDFYQSETSPRA
jgi:hypothetical protein